MKTYSAAYEQRPEYNRRGGAQLAAHARYKAACEYVLDNLGKHLGSGISIDDAIAALPEIENGTHGLEWYPRV